MFGDSDLLANLVQTVCPNCARAKRSEQSFCQACYFRLPRHVRLSLYARFGQGYERNFARALDILRNNETVARSWD